jgi:hypothetical protein
MSIEDFMSKDWYNKIKTISEEGNEWEVDETDETNGFVTFKKKIDDLECFKVQNFILKYPIDIVWDTIMNVENRTEWCKNNN